MIFIIDCVFYFSSELLQKIQLDVLKMLLLKTLLLTMLRFEFDRLFEHLNRFCVAEQTSDSRSPLVIIAVSLAAKPIRLSIVKLVTGRQCLFSISFLLFIIRCWLYLVV
jgi:hypothetical protein